MNLFIIKIEFMRKMMKLLGFDEFEDFK